MKTNQVPPGKRSTAGSALLNRKSSVPLYVQIALILKERILQKEFQGTTLPSTMDLAKSFSVSHRTIENAMALLVEENLVSRVKRRGTMPLSSLNALDRKARNCSIGFVCPGTIHDFWQVMLKAMQEQTESYGYSLDLYLYNWDDPADEQRALAKAWKNCSGVILHPNSRGSDRELICKYLDKNAALLLYLLFFDDLESGIVTSNSFLAGYELTKKLIAQNCRRIAFIHDKTHLITPQQRLEGFRYAMTEQGLDCSLVVDSTKPFPIKKYLQETQADAVVCSQVNLARKVSSFLPCSRIGIFAAPWQTTEIPDGMFCAFNQPEELGRSAVDEIISMIRFPNRVKRKIQIQHIVKQKGE